MPVLLVTYDLKKPGQDYNEFYKVRKRYNYARLSESSYAIATDESAETAFDKFHKHVDKNDRLFVIKLACEWKGLGSQEVYDWLHKNL